MTTFSQRAIVNIPADWKDIFRKYKPSLIEGLNAGAAAKQCEPPAELVFEAFRLTPYSEVRCVILGQDPYPTNACGLSFSVKPGDKIPGSLRNLHAALCRAGLSKGQTDGDLRRWATQGVLLLNSALTTEHGKSNVHAAAWATFTDHIITECSKREGTVFILFGKFAAEKRRLISSKCHILCWTHPSPTANTGDPETTPGHILNTTVFAAANKHLTPPIDWNIGTTDITQTTLNDKPSIRYYTDGGSRSNGKPGCQSAWALISVRNGTKVHELSGIPTGKQSNNRGELTAVLKALELAKMDIEAQPLAIVEIISDSEYSIKSVSEWGATPNTSTGKPRENYDLIKAAHDIYTANKGQIRFKHIRSHKAQPANINSQEFADWYYNDAVDKMCQDILGPEHKK